RVAPWLVLAATFVVLAASIVMGVYLGRRGGGGFTPHIFFVPGYAVVGAIIAARTRNMMGWLLLGFGALCAASTFFFLLIELGELSGKHGDNPIAAALWPTMYLFFGLVLLLFPTGAPANQFWRVVLWITLGSWGLAIVGQAVPAANVPIMIPVAVVSLMACAVAPIFRRRHASTELREQLRWLAFALGLGVVAAVVAILGGRSYPSLGQVAGSIAVLSAIVGIPVAVGIAITRYHLYDIGVIVNRTLVYLALTISLAAAYLMSVVILETVLDPLTHGSDVAVAGSTLAVAALFGPFRRRIQKIIDRRFYRSRYDAARTIDTFTARLRNEFDLPTVSRELVGVISETVHPAHVSLWLRDRNLAGPATPPTQT
ncbi:MAG TPA: hypothetical protein VFK89_10255, partial [Actinomycetota bacterium]|nr:hypothetical protein [Actinomycetota bacterium]